VLFTMSSTVTATVLVWPIGIGSAVPRFTDIGNPWAAAEARTDERRKKLAKVYNVLLNLCTFRTEFDVSVE